MSGYGREERGGREEGLAFNYLGFPRQEAIHLRVYAIFEGGREEGGGEIANGCNGARRQVCPKYYDNIYPESLIQRHRLRRIGVVRDCRWSRRIFWFRDRAGKEGILGLE